MKMKCAMFYLVLFFCVAIAYALDCPTCDTTLCEPHGRCPAGVVKDYCNCCDVCAKKLGEECGGPGDIYGKCGHLSICAKFPPPPPEVKDIIKWYDNKKGRCAPYRSF